MKKQTLFYFLIFISFSALAQSGPMLTKQETINYLDKKAKEVIGHYRTIERSDNNGNFTLYYDKNSVLLDGDNLTLKMSRRNKKEGAIGYSYYPCDYFEQTHENIFNPAHILKIEKASNIIGGEPIGAIKITLKANTGKWNFYIFTPIKEVTNINHEHFSKCYDLNEYLPGRVKESTKEVYLTYLQADDSNFDKIRKALEHLRDLYNAEDDPFGN